jgi:hypothetical protein
VVRLQAHPPHDVRQQFLRQARLPTIGDAFQGASDGRNVGLPTSVITLRTSRKSRASIAIVERTPARVPGPGMRCRNGPRCEGKGGMFPSR